MRAKCTACGEEETDTNPMVEMMTSVFEGPASNAATWNNDATAAETTMTLMGSASREGTRVKNGAGGNRPPRAIDHE